MSYQHFKFGRLFTLPEGEYDLRQIALHIGFKESELDDPRTRSTIGRHLSGLIGDSEAGLRFEVKGGGVKRRYFLRRVVPCESVVDQLAEDLRMLANRYLHDKRLVSLANEQHQFGTLANAATLVSTLANLVPICGKMQVKMSVEGPDIFVYEHGKGGVK